jgi:outer membrane protein OmpA-like peptidoglycan-associated protein
MKTTTVFLSAAIVAATSAGAQSPFSYEVGGLAHFAKFEKITTLDNGFGLGANLATYIHRRFALDLSVDAASNRSARTGNSLSVINNRIDLVYNHPIADQWRAMIGGGWTGTHFNGDKTKDEYDSGLNALVGLRYCVNDNWSWTGQALADLKDPADQTPAFNKTTTWNLRLGVSRFFGNNRAKGPCVNSTPAPLPPPPPPAQTAAPAPQPPAAPTPQPQPRPAPAPAPTPAPAPAPARAPAPAPAPTPPPRALMTFSPVYFAFDKVNLSKVATDSLDAVVRFMNANSNARIQVTGYTDNRGADDYNARLGARRATVVKDYLVSKGVSAGRVETMTKGESDPAESNDTEPGRAKNRRTVAVEVR